MQMAAIAANAALLPEGQPKRGDTSVSGLSAAESVTGFGLPTHYQVVFLAAHSGL